MLWQKHFSAFLFQHSLVLTLWTEEEFQMHLSTALKEQKPIKNTVFHKKSNTTSTAFDQIYSQIKVEIEFQILLQLCPFTISLIEAEKSFRLNAFKLQQQLNATKKGKRSRNFNNSTELTNIFA